jgi:hypothetical protein
MEERDHLDVISVHFVEESVGIDEQLPQDGIAELGNNTAAVTELRQPASCLQEPRQKHASGLGTPSRNVADCFIEGLASPKSPDYPAAPRSHFRRSSSATCS